MFFLFLLFFHVFNFGTTLYEIKRDYYCGFSSFFQSGRSDHKIFLMIQKVLFFIFQIFIRIKNQCFFGMVRLFTTKNFATSQKGLLRFSRCFHLKNCFLRPKDTLFLFCKIGEFSHKHFLNVVKYLRVLSFKGEAPTLHFPACFSLPTHKLDTDISEIYRVTFSQHDFVSNFY